MYTGLVAGTGTVLAAKPQQEGYRLRIETHNHVAPAPGDSVAVSGVCLTAECVGDGWFDAYCSETTVAKTAVADLEPGDPVNLESPLTVGDTLDGHLVRGCVETTAAVRSVESTGAGWRLAVAIPDGFEHLLITGGGVAVDGVSLTVASLDDDNGTFSVSVIPETAARTTLAELRPGDRVNLEPDALARYVARQAAVACTD
ncbi:riboflavin synthase [Haloarchaeobius sp. DFWS5]|uniref:riboflavin synthase n=1 Tax=Haloarchaeobius sp. DFWS5 TaxID=3446114 RepID=UPI003EC047BE